MFTCTIWIKCSLTEVSAFYMICNESKDRFWNQSLTLIWPLSRKSDQRALLKVKIWTIPHIRQIVNGPSSCGKREDTSYPEVIQVRLWKTVTFVTNRSCGKIYYVTWDADRSPWYMKFEFFARLLNGLILVISSTLRIEKLTTVSVPPNNDQGFFWHAFLHTHIFVHDK